MNKNLKKLGLLVVTAIAMAMGVNSASALKIAGKPVTGNGTYDDVQPNEAAITASVVKDGTSYNVTLNGAFKGEIEVQASDNVVLNLNGYSVNFEIKNRGILTINGENSIYSGTLRNYNTATNSAITLNYGDYSNATYIAASTNNKSVVINGIGTKFCAALNSNATSGEGVRSVSKNGYYVMAEALADMNGLSHAISGNHPGITSTSRRVNATVYFGIEAKYTKSSFANWKAAYEVAKALIDENENNPLGISKQPEIDAAEQAYLSAVNGLEFISKWYSDVEYWTNRVNDLLAEGEEKGIVYTDAAIKQAKDAIAYAEANSDLSDKHDDEVLQMAKNIQSALNNLTKNKKADYSDINKLETVISKLGKERFTTESWAVYQFAQDSIERDLPKNRQADVDKYYERLLAAAAGLTLAKNTGSTVTPGDSEPSNPGTTNPSDTDVTDPEGNNPGTTNPSTTEGENNNSGSTVNPNTGATGTTSDVNTSDNVAVYAVMNIASLIALAGCGLVLRKQN